MFWLAYKAAARPTGLGVLQARNDATEEDVWRNAVSSGDYSTNPNSSKSKPYGDYVFGRMLKLGLDLSMRDCVGTPQDTPRHDYQTWSYEYPTYAALLQAAIDSLQGGQPCT